MAFPLTLPSTPGIRTINVWRESVVGVSTSPFSLREQTYVHPGRRWRIEIEYPPMTAAQAEDWIQFFYDLNGREGSFNFNLTTYCPSLTPAPGVKVFRLLENMQGWSVSVAKHYGFTIAAAEVLLRARGTAAVTQPSQTAAAAGTATGP